MSRLGTLACALWQIGVIPIRLDKQYDIHAEYVTSLKALSRDCHMNKLGKQRRFYKCSVPVFSLYSVDFELASSYLTEFALLFMT